MKLIKPFKGNYPITQTFVQHEAVAKKNGWCTKPYPCPGGVWYYGAIDYGMPIGTALIAAHDGTLSFREEPGGYGKNARITWEENGVKYEIVYGHMSGFAGNPGHINTGEVIGFSGNTGFSEGPHVHFELRINGIPTDPTPYFVESYEPQPPIDKPFDGELPALPKKVRAITCEPMNVRIGATTSSKVVGLMPAGTTFTIVDYVVDGKNLWACIGGYPLLYVAMYHNGYRYVVLA